MKTILAGTYDSSDCMILLKENKTLQIEIDSVVIKQFGRQIKETILDVLNYRGYSNIYVKITDKGALEYTIRARLNEALDRWENET